MLLFNLLLAWFWSCGWFFKCTILLNINASLDFQCFFRNFRLPRNFSNAPFFLFLNIHVFWFFWRFFWTDIRNISRTFEISAGRQQKENKNFEFGNQKRALWISRWIKINLSDMNIYIPESKNIKQYPKTAPNCQNYFLFF